MTSKAIKLKTSITLSLRPSFDTLHVIQGKLIMSSLETVTFLLLSLYSLIHKYSWRSFS
ncbi:MAG TPA: hypothetical protein VIQ03_03545 [Gammaproteobacteria bacterium]